MYIIIDIEEQELKQVCRNSVDVIEFAKWYYDYLFAEDEDYDEKSKPYDWKTALDFLEANSRFVFDLENREKNNG